VALSRRHDFVLRLGEHDIKLGIFFLLVIFSKLVFTDISIQNCPGPQQAWIQAAIDDSIYLAAKAAKTLEEIIGMNPIRPQAQILLDSHLSTLANQNDKGQPIYKWILGKS